MDIEKQVNCSNCNKPQQASKIHLHEAYCLRNIRKCSECDEYIDKKEIESHKLQQHTNKQCEFCKQSFLPKEIEFHSSSCLMKPQKCAYCTLDVDGAEYFEHLKDCGSRTRECFLCGKNIILFNYEDHMDTCVGAEEQTYESKFPSHAQAFGPIQPKQKKQQDNVKPYQPVNTKISSTKVQIGSVKQQIKQESQYKAEQEFVSKFQQAYQSGDNSQLKKLQEEEDERVAWEMNSRFSPKNKTVQEAIKNQQNQQKQGFDDYNYNYDDEDFQNDYQQEQYQEQEDIQKKKQQQPEVQKTKEVKEMEELGEFIENDPELQQAILMSQMKK